MISYLKTEIEPKFIQPIVQYYIKLNSNKLVLPDKVINYIKENFVVDIPEILSAMIDNIRVSKIDSDLVSVYILNTTINDTTLENVLQLIEFGNRELPPTYQITRLMNVALTQTENRLGGV